MYEYDHMKLLRKGPHIAAIHDGLEFSQKSGTLSFFMDYYKGKDLDRHVHMLRGAGERFTEPQIIDIGYQIAEALEFCHSRNILHQDMKPMNVLLKDVWNPLSSSDVPDLFVADFGIASRVGTLGTRLTGQRGTPGYEAPEIRQQGGYAAFSQKSDIYAFGCILYRLCTLQEPGAIEDIKPTDISSDYSIDLTNLITSMLGSSRVNRPTASGVKEHFMALMHKYLSTARECRTCGCLFLSLNGLRKHLKKTGHHRKESLPVHTEQNSDERMGGTTPNGLEWSDEEPELRIRGVAKTLDCEGLNDVDDTDDADNLDYSPCLVCLKHFNSKQKFFRHLGGAHHWRNPRFIMKRRMDNELVIDESKRQRMHRESQW